MAIYAAQVEAGLAGYIDNSGSPASSGKLRTYATGTTDNKTTWQDKDKAQAHANPIILDSTGRKAIFADGVYDFYLYDQNDNLIRTYLGLQYIYFLGDITSTTTITALDSNGLSLKDDGGNTGITIKDGGNVGIKGDVNPQTAFGVADSDATAYSDTISVTSVGSDVTRFRNISASAEFVSILSEVGSGNAGISRLITRKDSSNETSWYVQLRDASASTVTATQLSLTSEGLLTIGSQINVGNLTLTGNTLRSSSGDINITPNSGDDVVIDSHFEFDGNLLTALTNNDTVLTAYAGKNFTIESVTFDGGVVGGITDLTMSGILNVDSGTLYVDSINNKVGVNTTSPSVELHVIGASASGVAIIETTSVSDSLILSLRGRGGVSQRFNPSLVAGTQYNWQLDANVLVNQGFSIAPSTLVGGSVFSTPALSILNTGNIGIGTAGTISARLHVISTTEQLRLGYNASNYCSVTVNSSGNTTLTATGTSPLFILSNALTISPANTAGPQQGIRFYDSGTGSGEGLYLQWESASRVDMAQIRGIGASTGGSLNFYTNAANTGSAINRMILDSSGNLGVGNLAPTYRLDVEITSGPYSGRFQNTSTSTSQYNVVRFAQGAGSGAASGYLGTGGSAVANSAFAGNMVIGTDNSSALVFATNDSARAWITSSGNFGIGINPSIKFEVVNGGTPSGYLSSTVASFINSASSGTNCYVNIQSGITGVAGFVLGDSAASDVSKIYLDNSVNSLNFVNSGYTMSFSNAGLFTFPNSYTAASQPKVSCYQSAGQTIATGSAQNITFNSELYDYTTMHSTSANNHLVTIQESGTYLVIGTCEWDANSVAGYRKFLLVKNGSNYSSHVFESVSYTTYSRRASISEVLVLAATDTISLIADQNSGVNVGIRAVLQLIKLS